MPHWGLALALGPNYNMPPVPEREEKAWQAVERAVKLARTAPEHERAYVSALAKRYSKDPAVDRGQLGVLYKDAMKAVMLRYPDDLDAATLYAESLMNLRPWQLWTADGQPAEGTLDILDVLERVLRRNPDHPGANHYYIHAIEASRHPERALPSAMRLGTLMPGAGHMVHMPSHIFLRLGDYEASATVNITAAKVDREYIARSGAKGVYPLMYYSHNLHFVAYARLFQGRYDESLDYARQLRANVHGAIKKMPMIASYGAFEWLVLVTSGRWEEILKQAKPAEENAFLHALYHCARTAAFAAKGNMSKAEAEYARLQAAAKRIPESETLMINSARSVIEVGLADAQARLSRCKGDTEQEINHLRRAVERQDALAYMEPPEWHYTLRTSLGAALLRSGQVAEAEAVFRKDLEHHPRNARSLFGLWQALRLQSKGVQATWVQKEFEQAWKQAQFPLHVDRL